MYLQNKWRRTHHLPNNAQTVPQSGYPPALIPTVLKGFLYNAEWYGIFLQTVEVSFLFLCPPNSLCPLSPHHWQNNTRSWNSFGSAQYCSVVAKTSVCYQCCFFSQSQNKAWYQTLQKMKNKPVPVETKTPS